MVRRGALVRPTSPRSGSAHSTSRPISTAAGTVQPNSQRQSKFETMKAPATGASAPPKTISTMKALSALARRSAGMPIWIRMRQAPSIGPTK